MIPKEVLQAWYKAFIARDVDALCNLYADDAINYQVAETPLIGKEAIRESFINFFAMFPDETTEVLNIFEDGEWAICEWKGGIKGQSPNSEVPDFHGCGFFHVRNGKIIFQRGYWDKLTFLNLHSLPLE